MSLIWNTEKLLWSEYGGRLKNRRTKNEEYKEKEGRSREMNRGGGGVKPHIAKYFPFRGHLAAIVDSNDWPVSADQSRRQIHDGTIPQ
jgi:hypothetical protein